jgi:hypothetical protein
LPQHISNQDIAHGLLSRATLGKGEQNLAAMSLLKTGQELIVHEVKYTAGQGDHGNRSGIDHYPKTLHCPVKDKNGNWKIGRPTLDVDSAGRTAPECAAGWQISLDPIPGVTLLQPMKKLMCPKQSQQQRAQINVAAEEELFAPGGHLQTIQHQQHQPIHHTIE